MSSESSDSDETQTAQEQPAAISAPAHSLNVWERLKEHKVAQWTLAYAAAAYAVLHGAQMLSDAFEWPRVLVRIVAMLLLFGLPLVATLAWYHGHRGQQRASSTELTIIAGLLVIAGAALWHFARPSQERAAAKVDAMAENTGAALPPATANAPERSIAVLPFLDLSEKKDQEYFADGMAEEILDLLAKIPGITVIGRTSSFQFKARNEDLRAIGSKLNAAHVLEGSVRKSGDQVRITAQLIDTRTGTHEWSETYDRHIGDVLKLQDAIAAAVVRELQLTVASEHRSSRTTLKSADAYDLVLRGRHEADRFDKEGLEEAVRLFQQALDRDPTSADAAAGLAHAYFNLGAYGLLAPAVAYEQSRRAVTKVLKLDPRNASAHWILGGIHLVYDWNWTATDQDYQQVAALAPGSWDALQGKAWLSLVLGRWDEGLSQIRAALAQDPLNPDSYEGLAWIQMGRAHLPEAEAAIRRALDIRPTYSWGALHARPSVAQERQPSCRVARDAAGAARGRTDGRLGHGLSRARKSRGCRRHARAPCQGAGNRQRISNRDRLCLPWPVR